MGGSEIKHRQALARKFFVGLVASSARHPTKDAERCCWLQGIAGGSLGRYAPLVFASAR